MDVNTLLYLAVSAVGGYLVRHYNLLSMLGLGNSSSDSGSSNSSDPPAGSSLKDLLVSLLKQELGVKDSGGSGGAGSFLQDAESALLKAVQSGTLQDHHILAYLLQRLTGQKQAASSQQTAAK